MVYSLCTLVKEVDILYLYIHTTYYYYDLTILLSVRLQFITKCLHIYSPLLTYYFQLLSKCDISSKATL